MPVLNRTKPQILDIPRHRILTTLPKQEGVPEPETPETQNEDKTVGAPEPEALQTLETQKVREKKYSPIYKRGLNTYKLPESLQSSSPKKKPKKNPNTRFPGTQQPQT